MQRGTRIVECRNQAMSWRSVADKSHVQGLLLDNEAGTAATVQLLTLLMGFAILACLQMEMRLQSALC